MSSARKTSEAVRDDEWMSVEEAMRTLGNGRSTVLNLVVAGALVAQVIARRTVIRRDTVEAELARRQQRAAEMGVPAAQ